MEREAAREERRAGRRADLVSIKSIDLQPTRGERVDGRRIHLRVVVAHAVPAEIVLRLVAAARSVSPAIDSQPGRAPGGSTAGASAQRAAAAAAGEQQQVPAACSARAYHEDEDQVGLAGDR